MDYRRLDDFFPARKTLEPGFCYSSFVGFKHVIGDSIPDQYFGIRKIMENAATDLVLADATFWGTFPLLLGDPESRPPALPEFFLDCFYTLPDVLLEFTAAAFEYPGSDKPFTSQLVKPVLTKPLTEFSPPAWCKDLYGQRLTASYQKSLLHLHPYAEIDMCSFCAPPICEEGCFGMRFPIIPFGTSRTCFWRIVARHP